VSRRLRRALWVVSIAGAAFLLWFLDHLGGTLACGRAPFRIRGVVIDARTGAPVPGAAVLTLRDPEIVRDPKELESWRSEASEFAELSERELVSWAWYVGSAHTDAKGSFEIIAGDGVSTYTGISGIVWNRDRADPFEAARALLVEREGYVSAVFETREARWLERREGRIIGTLDVGAISIAPQSR